MESVDKSGGFLKYRMMVKKMEAMENTFGAIAVV